MSKGASCGCPLNTVSNGDSSQQIARTMVANVAKLSPSPPFLHSSTPSSTQTHYMLLVYQGFFRVKMILKQAEYIMSKTSQCKSAQKQPGFGRSRECDCHKQWRADHTTKYHYCNLLSSSRDQISLLSFFRKTPNPFFFGLLVRLCSYSLFDDLENAKKGIDWLRYFICELA